MDNTNKTNNTDNNNNNNTNNNNTNNNQKKSSLFIHISKKARLEYITCKKYDIDEINFYKELKKYNNES